MSSWNRLFPNIISQNDDTTWAYTNIRPALFLLDPETLTFVWHPISDTPGLRGFSYPDWRREHEDRTINRRNHGDGPIYAYVRISCSRSSPVSWKKQWCLQLGLQVIASHLIFRAPASLHMSKDKSGFVAAAPKKDI